MSRLEPELASLIGEDALVRLAEAFGGTRLYVPQAIATGHAIAQAIGLEAARTLVARFAPDVIDVPLAKDLRARHYRAQRRTNAQIATALGMTERGVERLLARIGAAASTAQLSLFDG